MNLTEKIDVGILGATGSVGRRLVEKLLNHPWFTITALAASERSVGKRYGDVCSVRGLSDVLRKKVIRPCEPSLPCSIVFSALDSTVAGPIEEAFAHNGYIVSSNARNHRMRADVPLLIPEINGDHLALISQQRFNKGGIIVTNPNCVVAGLALALKPLHDAFGLRSVYVVTMQAVSGAGDAGKLLDISDNIIPFISGEEEKIESEPLKILGSLRNGQVNPSDTSISAQVNRVPVSDGHTVSVSVKLGRDTRPEDILRAWETFPSIDLPTAPKLPIHYLQGASPQPKHHRDIEGGMAISIGQLRPCSLFDYKFTLLTHNTVRGAAGGAIMNAELVLQRYPHLLRSIASTASFV